MSDSPKTQEGRNGGTLNVGGNEGNRYGAGRKPRELRRQLQGGLDAALETLIKIALGTHEWKDGEGKVCRPTANEMLRAIDLLAKYGIGLKIDHTSDDSPLKAYVALDVEKVCSPKDDEESEEA
jgi:hypothetical protein